MTSAVGGNVALPAPTGHLADGTPFWMSPRGETISATVNGVVRRVGTTNFLEEDVATLEQFVVAVLAAIQEHRRIAADPSCPQVGSSTRAAELAAPPWGNPNPKETTS